MTDINWHDPEIWNEEGYIYLIRDGDKYKIGKAVDVNKRMARLQTSTANPLILEWQTHSLACQRTEKYLHRKFAPKRIRGEWFELEEKDIQWLKSTSGMRLDMMALKDPVCIICGAKNHQPCKCPRPSRETPKPIPQNRQFVYTQIEGRNGEMLERCRHCGKWFKSHGKYIYCYGCREIGNTMDNL